MDRAIGDFVAADVLIEDDRIAAISPRIDASDAEIIDAQGMVVLPGLVNAHLHTWQTALRGIAADWTGPDYHRDMHGNLATRFSADDNYIGNLMGALDQINGGVTTIFDWCHNITSLEHAERAIDGLEESGIRAVFGHGTAKPMISDDQTPFTHQPHPRQRVEALRKGRFASDDRRVTLALAILGPQLSTAEVTQKDFRLARELDLLSTSHASRRRSDWLNPQGYRLATDIGALGPDHNLVHANYLDDDELQLVLDHGASVTVTAMIELHVHVEDPVSARLLAHGALPSLGVDSIPTANSDMFNEMRTTLLFQQAREQRANHKQGKQPLLRLSTTTRDVLTWATLGGARALGLEDKIGSLTPGKKADVILINGNDLNIFPVHDAVTSVVQQANGSNVDTVLIDGEVLKRGGKLVHSAAELNRKRTALMESSLRIIRDAGFSERYPQPPGRVNISDIKTAAGC